MDEKMIQAKIQAGRNFMKYHIDDEFGDFISDQTKKLPQPPLVKKSLHSEIIALPRNFEECDIKEDFTTILIQRKSSRIFTQQSISLLQLSYLLWATQGVKSVRGKAYATLRTVPSGGARHGFETYLIIQKCEGCQPGLYHYSPMEHQLELVEEKDDLDSSISNSLMKQSWASKASVVFYWSFVPYRCEWRYGIYAHRVALIDAGHIGQNCYLACTALGLGTCAIAALDEPFCNQLFQLDGKEEFMIYAAPVGTIDVNDLEKEKSFYQFVEDEGL